MSESRDPAVGASEPSVGEETTPAGSQTELRTFMIADIRGYTAYTREHGDEAAAALATRFAQLVAEIVSARDGFLLEVRGDEALVAFASARRALRAAVDLQARFAAEKLPRGVGIGLDAGEAIPVGSGYRGTALNLAARLSATAAAGETLASEAVIHLAAKMDGIAYVDPRALKLKGFAESVRAVLVVPADGARGHRVASSGRRWAFATRRAAFVAVAAILVVVLVGGAVGGSLLVGQVTPTAAPSATSQSSMASPSAAATEPATPSSSPDPLGGASLPVLAFFDATTGELQATTPFASPRNIAFFSRGSFWILGENPKSFNRVDPATHQVVQSIPIPVVESSGFNFDDDYIWVTDLGAPRVLRIDQRTGVVTEFDLAADEEDDAVGVDVAAGAGSVWVSRPDAEEIVRLDRVTGEIQARLDIFAFGTTFGDGGLWWWREGIIGRIDPLTNQPAFEPVALATDSWLGNIYIGGGDAWTSSSSTGRVWRVDRSGGHSTFAFEAGVGEMAATERTMWVTNARTGELTGIDLATGQRNRSIDTGHATLAVAASDDELMVAVGPTADEVIAGLEGSVLTLATSAVPWWDPAPDPPTNWWAPVRQMLYLTCVSLLAYPDEPGPGGMQLQPELAADMPTVSPDGRTYTFRIRPGFSFSPPSNEPVTAETMRATIERALSPLLDEGQPGPQMFGDILGAQEYRQGEADHVAGLAAAGDELSITLVEPAPDILDRLATGFACPVPLNTPVVRSGLNPDPPIGGTGPYYLAQTVRKRLVVFRKNPNYAGTRPQPFDAIAIHVDTTAASAIAMVEGGTLDVALLDSGESLSAPDSALAREWGPGSANAAAGDQRWFGAAGFGVDYIALNATRPAFSDPEVRRAVALALDRVALAGIWTNAPAASLLVPSVRGGPPEGAAVPTPDMEAAQALMNGRTLDVTMMGFPEAWQCGPCRDFEVAITGRLQEIGLTVTVRHPDGDEYPADALDPGSDIDLLLLGTGTEFPDPAEMLSGMSENVWLGSEHLAELDELQVLSGEERVNRAAAFADRVADDEALVVPVGHGVFTFFTSRRIGCEFVQPAVGALDLLRLCTADAGAGVDTPASP